MNGIRPPMLVPLIAIAFLSAALGFYVQRELGPPPRDDRVRVSVVALEATPEPSSTPAPTEEPEPRVRVSTGRRGSDGSDRRGQGGTASCPAGCTCESRPPQGVVIVCR